MAFSNLPWRFSAFRCLRVIDMYAFPLLSSDSRDCRLAGDLTGFFSWATLIRFIGAAGQHLCLDAFLLFLGMENSFQLSIASHSPLSLLLEGFEPPLTLFSALAIPYTAVMI